MQKKLFYLGCFLIAYGSLYPFEFNSSVDSEIYKQFLDSWYRNSSIGDVIGNIVLFVPFGLFGYRLWSSWWLSLVGLFLAIILQVAQLYLPSRAPALYDVYWNLLGIAIGIGCAVYFKPDELYKHRVSADKQASIILLMFWLAFQLSPFVPTIDWQAYKDAIKPLLFEPRLDFEVFLFLTVAWLVVANFAKEIFDKNWRSGFLWLAVILILLAKIIIVTNILTLNDVAAAISACFLYSSFSRFDTRRYWHFLAVALLCAYAINSLFPLEFESDAKSFIWVPFSGFLNGSMLINSIALSKKLFVFIGVFLVFKQARFFNKLSILSVIFAIGLVEILQLWIVGRSAEITDPLLAAFIAWTLWGAEKQPSSKTEMKISPVILAAERILLGGGLLVKGERGLEGESGFLASKSQRDKTILGGMAISLLITLIFYFIIRLPNVPYNVRELFKYGGNGIDLFIFSLALLALGAGPAWMGCKVANANSIIVKAPMLAIVVSIVIFILFYFSVTEESMMDIAGTSVVIDRVGEQGVLGVIGKEFVASVGADNLSAITDVFEPVIRFGALFGPLIIFFGLVFATFFRNKQLAEQGAIIRFYLFCKQLFIYIIYMLPWFYFCKVIAFDWSSTDNLNELITRDGDYGIGGGGYLYALLSLILLSAGFLAWMIAMESITKVLAVVSFSAIAVLPGWLLLNAGLTDNVGKYELNFSGVDFLLGPDRKHLLSNAELFIRWSLLQFCATLGLACGAVLYLKLHSQFLGKINHFKKPSPVATTAILSELRVSFDQSQVEFLEQLSSRIGENLSATTALIILFMKKEFDGAPDLRNMFYKEIINRQDYQAKSLSPVILKLPSAQMKFITELLVNTGVSSFDVVIKIINIFMTASRQEALSNRAVP